ncbi:9184_t:CDS:2 [Funneliformis mosseae]|uniref:9184_t:CDS:1 n=1 Tax=Funneliformis mosseae TaxID=27381 RepID=A0A9N9FKQ0_FUNMO|nr:9184_t:CDS:2 [Funneliformis mosseae]
MHLQGSDSELAKLTYFLFRNSRTLLVARLRYDIEKIKQQTQVITEMQYAIEDIFSENPRHNNSTNNSELTKSHSKTVTKCHDQNSVLDNPNNDILELEN